MSHAKKLRTTIGLSDSDCRLIKLHQHNLRASLVHCRVNYYNWFRKHLGWTEKNGDPLLDGVCESYIGGSYDETFCSIQYNQAIHWHEKGMGAGHVLAAQSALRHLFIDIAQKLGQTDLAKALCRVIDLTQSVQSMVFHLAHTLDRLRRVAEQVSLRPRERFWDIPVPKIDSAFDSLFVPRPSRSLALRDNLA
ncbi:MAG: hypothetical protein JMN24_18770, partial [gamma proteobacterium endosymbiont of Lamellibrachia anaximandri]|nr:hypothetical protein [gamma proteobacterium endosymbiont of Lamellibrachia anaximandri]